ncbi:MEDS domain-containing protein [Natrarchaeobius chitinivorans]|uniref:MEDS domain-containing protein n=1 Tax=Natrarchaeobius chitinivorans TaxID=1679083 RepID=UPI0014042E2F|nr:MEDS domain-containing protein [Natrarchaeobius chitinivorans]
MEFNIENQGLNISNFNQKRLQSRLQKTADANHLALLFDTVEEQLNATIPFLKSGLENNESCLYLADESTEKEIWSALEGVGVDRDAVDTGQLVVEKVGDTYLDGPGFDVDSMLDFLMGTVDDQLESGFDGLRVTGEMTWTINQDIPFKDIVEYESRFDQLAADLPCVALCQYDLDRFAPEKLIDVIHTHPHIVYKGKICSNTYYTPPDEFLGAEKPELEVDRMLDTTFDLASAQDEILRREQRLQVVNRVLRHNIRNDLNVILGHSDILSEELDSEELQSSAEQIHTTAQELFAIAKEAKRIEDSLDEKPPVQVPLPLSQIVGRIIEDVMRENPGKQIRSSLEDEIWVEGSEDLEFAVQMLLETLIEHTDTVNISAEIEGKGSYATFDLVIEVEEQTLPDSEIESLMKGQETPLRHSSGIGLWIVNWIVESSDGELSFETDNEYTRIIVSLTALEENGVEEH